MKKYSEEAEYNIVTIDDFLTLLSDNDIQVRINELETDIELAVPVTNVEIERTPMAACVEITSIILGPKSCSRLNLSNNNELQSCSPSKNGSFL